MRSKQVFLDTIWLFLTDGSFDDDQCAKGHCFVYTVRLDWTRVALESRNVDERRGSEEACPQWKGEVTDDVIALRKSSSFLLYDFQIDDEAGPRSKTMCSLPGEITRCLEMPTTTITNTTRKLRGKDAQHPGLEAPSAQRRVPWLM